MPPNTTTPPAPASTTPQPPVTPAPAAPNPQKPKGGMLPKIILVVLILLAGLVVAYALTRPKDKSSNTTTNTAPNPTAETKPEVVKVSITNAAFDPASITIKSGTQVTWTNNDTAIHQVAADPYPKNDSIPGFDSTVVLQPKDDTSFIFTKAGTYTVHDEKNPLVIKGTIVVQ